MIDHWRTLLCIFWIAVCCRTAAADRVFFVSPAGNDASAGTSAVLSETDGPFRTLDRALRAANAASLTAPGPTTIRLGTGTYFLDQPVALPGHLSSADAPLTLAANSGATPILSGGMAVKGWRPLNVSGHDCWGATLPITTDFHELWVNHRRATRARYPRTGYLAVPADAPVTEHYDQRQAFLPVNPAELPASLDDHVEAVICDRWVESRVPVLGIDGPKRRLQLGKLTMLASHAGDKYWLEGSPAFLAKPGDWCIDRANQRLLYLPRPGETIDTVDALVPHLDCLLVVGGATPGDAVTGLTIRGITFEGNEWNLPTTAMPATVVATTQTVSAANLVDPAASGFGQADIGVPAAVRLSRATGCTFEDCRFEHLGSYALELGVGCQQNVISHCNFNDLGAGGIKIGQTTLHPSSMSTEPPPDELEQTHGNQVSDCRITDGGHTFPSAVGIWIGQSYENDLIHNEVADFYYTGISIGWTWGYGPSHAMGNRVEGNRIHHIGIKTDGDGPILSDMGGIYTLGVQPGTVVRGNVFHDVAGQEYGGWGIYLDEGSSGILVEKNLVYRTTHGGFHQHYGQDNLIRNNIFAFGRDTQLVCTRPEPHCAFTFEHNIVFGSSQPFMRVADRARPRFASNLYWDPAGDINTARLGSLSWTQWRAAGQDEHSTWADPLFVDPVHGDFNQAPMSPAARIGFETTDWNNVGPRSD